MSSNQLPEEFADLEAFVTAWALPSEIARRTKRLASTMEEIQAFYDAMLARGEAILRHLESLERAGAPDAIPEASQRLLYLMFSLAEVAPAVEVFKQPSVIDGFDAARFEPDHESEDWKRMRHRRAAPPR